MASPPRGLVYVLTMVAWLAASIHTGSPYSGWWGTQEATALRQAAKKSRAQGDFAGVRAIYRHIAEIAARHHDPLARAWALEGAGSASLAIFDYRSALEAYLQAKKFAEQARDRRSLGAIDADLASLYEQTLDLDSAVRSAGEARRITEGLSGVYYRPQLLFLLGRLRGGAEAIALYKEGIAAAHGADARDPMRPAVEPAGWDALCVALLAAGDSTGAEAAEQKARTLRQSSHQADLGFSDWLLGAVRLQQARQPQAGPDRERLLTEAEKLTRRAMNEKRRPPKAQLDDHLVRILEAQGRTREALAALEQAVVEAQRWRLGIAPAATSLDGAAAQLQTGIFDRFVDAAADYGLRSQDPRWIEESFEATELNRAQNLRDSAGTAVRRLPVEYWEALGQLEAEEVRSPAGSASSPLADRLRLKLTELEGKAGLGYFPTIAENFPSHDSLIHFQKSLRDSDLLVSFALGAEESWLWAVTRGTLRAYRLPPAAEIVDTVRAFRQAVEEGGTGFEDLGGQLYRMLFGQLRAEEVAKTSWQLSVEDALLEIPFAALVIEREAPGPGNHKRGEGGGQIVFLVERHSLQVKAGALLPGNDPQKPPSGFVAVGDPIYNIADARWKAHGSTLALDWLPIDFRQGAGSQFNRLPGTRREVEDSAAAWMTAGQGPATILEGAAATRGEFLKALLPVPRVIHLATHALTSNTGDEAYLAFGLGRDGEPRMLSASEIRTLRVPGSVVVMTGCSTAPSDVRAGLGLAGLVRAWTIAGASAVVATEWAVEDSAGSSLLAGFYRHLGRAPAGTVTEALRLAQIEAMHTAGAMPSVWAAYQVFAGRLGSRGDAP
jgi:CHAT domain-containing protein/tetratricopeptide (TPR) repeat protein